MKETTTCVSCSKRHGTLTSERAMPPKLAGNLVTIAIAGLVTVALTSARTARPANASETPQASPAVTHEAQRQAACDAFWAHRSERVQLAHDAQGKDPAWAYSMEQRLSDYTTREFRASQIIVSGIDCKTTFCTLTAEGVVPETNREFERAMNHLRGLPWNDFYTMALSQREESGKMLYSAEVHRREPSSKTHEQLDEERTEAACGELLKRASDRQRAAQDAQPRDVSWAGPAEQRLREYFASPLVNQHFDKLEVTCKTTFCWVKASGLAFEAYSAFHKAAQEIAAKPWDDLESAGGQGSAERDIWTQEFQFDRRSATRREEALWRSALMSDAGFPQLSVNDFTESASTCKFDQAQWQPPPPSVCTDLEWHSSH
jgi:hypothetical protein